MTVSSEVRRPGRRPLRVAIVLLVLAAVAAALWYATRPDPVPVLVRPVERGRVEETVANTRAGSVRACRRANLAPSTGGQVADLPISEGTRVKKGDVLLALWNDDLAAQVALAESQAVAARARAEEACVLRDQAAREEERQRKLFADGLTSDEKVEQALSHLEVTRAACKAAEAATRESDAQVRVARAAFEKTVLRAPFDGVVAEVNAELGEYVTPSPPGIPTLPAVDLIEAGCIEVVAPIDEVDAPRVQVGLQARVRLDAFPERTFAGRVSRVAPYVLEREKQARTVDVDVELDGESDIDLMLPGYSADVEILINAREDVPRVPTEAIVGGGTVLVLRDGVLVERAIEKGLSNWEQTEIISGLSEGELVVVSLGREGVEAGAAAVEE